MIDDGIPDWARPLTRGPIEVDERTTFDELAKEFSERLDALMKHYQCDATPEGWRRLALRLALDHEIEQGTPAMRVIVPVDRLPEAGGAEPGKNWGLAARLEKRARDLGSIKAAAKELAKTTGLSVGRLQNIAADKKAGRVSKPRGIQRMPWNQWIAAALETAADRLEDGHETESLLS